MKTHLQAQKEARIIEGQRFKIFRTQYANLSQTRLAEKLECKQSHISEGESGKSGLSLEILRRLYIEFGYNSNYHITGEGSVIISISDNKISAMNIQEESSSYIPTPKNLDLESKFEKLSEENISLKKQIEVLNKELSSVGSRLTKALEKIIQLLENSGKHEYA